MKLKQRSPTTLVLAGWLFCLPSAASAQETGSRADAPVTRAQALALLREAADQGHADAQAMLVSLEGSAVRPMGSSAGRRQSPGYPMDRSFLDPSLIRPPGYHCHTLKFGVTWCHDRGDGQGY